MSRTSDRQQWDINVRVGLLESDADNHDAARRATDAKVTWMVRLLVGGIFALLINVASNLYIAHLITTNVRVHP